MFRHPIISDKQFYSESFYAIQEGEDYDAGQVYGLRLAKPHFNQDCKPCKVLYAFFETPEEAEEWELANPREGRLFIAF